MICGRGLAAQWKRERKDDYKSIKGTRIVKITQINDCILFPVKFHWYEKASLELIKKSMEELFLFSQQNPNAKVYLPQVGCGFGV